MEFQPWHNFQLNAGDAGYTVIGSELRVTGFDTIMPCAKLELEYLPESKRTAAAILMLRTADQDAVAATGRRPSVLVHAVVCYEVDAATWGSADLRNLVHGLEALVSLFGINRDSSLPVSSA